jgi:MFS family permease
VTERDGRRTLVASLLGVFVGLFPVLIVVAALPEIAADLDTSEATLAWVLTAPLITSAVVLPTAGRLGDLHGHRRLFLIGLTVSGTFAGLAALAWDPLSLIVFRTISQAAGTAVSPSAIALVISAHSVEDRSRVLGLWASSTAVAPAAGLLIGGPAVDALSWRGLFVLQAVVVLLVVPYGARVLRETVKAARVAFDLPGAGAFMAASGALVFGLDRAGRWGWDHPAVAASLIVAVLAVPAFLRVERRATDPILAPHLLRHRSFLSSCGTELLVQVTTNGGLFVAPLLFHETYGAGVGRIAWYMAGLPIGMSISAPLGGRLAAAIGERASAVLGMVLLGIAFLVMIPFDEAEWLWAVLLAWLLTGIANGFVRPAIASAAAAALEPSAYGAGMAATRMLSTVGAAGGITLAISLLPLGGFHLVFAVAGIGSFLGAAAALGLHVTEPPSAEAELEAEIGFAPGPT